MELFDIYNKDHEKMGWSGCRGVPLNDGDYGLIVHVWIKGSDGKYLISKRAKHKSFGGMWECPGGGAIEGETSLETALREVKEEIGITLDASKGRLIKFCVYEKIHVICDVWLFTQDICTESIVLQDDEVSEVKRVTPQEILFLCKSGEFVPVYGYIEWLFDINNNSL